MKDLDFEAIFERYHQRLYRFCLSIVGNPEDAREALQNTMVKALRSLPDEEREIAIKPWLYRVAHNESIDLLRRRRERVELDPELVSGSDGLAEQAELRDRLRALLADLRELPERQRAALVMRELAGLEFAEIGEAFDTSAGVARQTVYEARLSLQQLKEGREMDCEKARYELSAEDGRVTRRRDIQAHLRECAECRAFGEAIAERRHDLAALAPLPVAASAGVLHAVLAGSQSVGGGLTGTVGAGVGKAAMGSGVIKSAATVAVVAAIAVPAADRSGLVDVGLFNRGGPHARQAAPGPAQPADSVIDSGDGSSDGPLQANSRRRRPLAITRAKAVRQGRASDETPLTGSPASVTTTPIEPSAGPSPASNRGQETAASHGGGREHAASKGKGRSHASAEPPPQKHKQPHAKPPGRNDKPPKEHPAHPPSGQPPHPTPDKKPAKPLQPPEPPEANGPPEERGGRPSKEAR